MYKFIFKPLIDWLIALIALVILSPLFILVAIAIVLDTKGPVFFIQPRLGHNGKVFNIYKFRSMIDNNVKNKENKLYMTDPRITRVGRILRKTSVDELPQILNILVGDMSFIGPRPPVPYFPKKIEEYNAYEYQRFKVKPGISGLAQIRCREIHDWNINIPIDVEYVQNYSFLFDLRLFFKSLLVFFKYDNIYRKD